MSKNALALVDCGERDILFQFLIKEVDRKTVKNEMISPYDDQLIGKMNFSYRGVEHSMFFTYARAAEYPGMRFRNHKIIYLSLGVSEISSEIFTKICSHFGGFLDHNDDLEDGWQRIEQQINEDEEMLGETAVDWSKQVAAEEIQSALQEPVQVFRENQKPGSERKESHRKEGKQQERYGEQRRRSEKSERREDVCRGQRHERREDNRTEKKGNPRRTAPKKVEKRMTEKKEKAAGNESQS